MFRREKEEGRLPNMERKQLSLITAMAPVVVDVGNDVENANVPRREIFPCAKVLPMALQLGVKLLPAFSIY
jgi:hypothetical protein